jgi:hypothetical protein
MLLRIRALFALLERSSEDIGERKFSGKIPAQPHFSFLRCGIYHADFDVRWVAAKHTASPDRVLNYEQ